MGNLNGFDSNEWESGAGKFDPIPAGDYTVIVTKSEMKNTKQGDGKLLELTLQVVGEEGKGRLLWDRLNLDNPNATAVEIAKRTLGDICRAVGVLTPSDSSELHDKPLVARVTVEPRKDTGEPSNRIKRYLAVGGETPKAAAPAPSAPKPAGAKSAPWARK